DGNYVQSASTKDIHKDDIIRWMVGREITNLYPQKQSAMNGTELFRVEDWNVFHSNDKGNKIAENLSFNVKKGEILGIYGLVGSRRTELGESICVGRFGHSTERMYLNNQPITIKDPAQAIECGIALITEDRKKTGLVLGLSVKENFSLASL